MQRKLNTAQASSEGADYVVRQERALAIALVALALGVAANSILGPVGLGLMRYRTSATTLNQLLGSDAAALFVVVPITVAAAVLAFRRHPVAPLVAVGIGVYALYTYAQVIIGQEYLRLPGNVDRFFPLLLTIFIVAEVVVVLAWRLAPPTPPAAPKLERICCCSAAVGGCVPGVWPTPASHDHRMAGSGQPHRVRLQSHAVLDGETDGSWHHRSGRSTDGDGLFNVLIGLAGRCM